jgi:hypothetical protein
MNKLTNCVSSFLLSSAILLGYGCGKEESPKTGANASSEAKFAYLESKVSKLFESDKKREIKIDQKVYGQCEIIAIVLDSGVAQGFDFGLGGLMERNQLKNRSDCFSSYDVVIAKGKDNITLFDSASYSDFFEDERMYSPKIAVFSQKISDKNAAAGNFSCEGSIYKVSGVKKTFLLRVDSLSQSNCSLSVLNYDEKDSKMKIDSINEIIVKYTGAIDKKDMAMLKEVTTPDLFNFVKEMGNVYDVRNLVLSSNVKIHSAKFDKKIKNHCYITLCSNNNNPSTSFEMVCLDDGWKICKYLDSAVSKFKPNFSTPMDTFSTVAYAIEKKDMGIIKECFPNFGEREIGIYKRKFNENHFRMYEMINSRLQEIIYKGEPKNKVLNS